MKKQHELTRDELLMYDYYSSLTYWQLRDIINNPLFLDAYRERCKQELDKRLSEEAEIINL